MERSNFYVPPHRRCIANYNYLCIRIGIRTTLVTFCIFPGAL